MEESDGSDFERVALQTCKIQMSLNLKYILTPLWFLVLFRQNQWA